jgi:beta-lactamase class A
VRRHGFTLWLAAFVFAPPAWAETPIDPRGLEQQLAVSASQDSGEYGMAALDLATGQIVSFNGAKSFPMASTMKIAVAAAYLADVDAGRRSLDDQISGVTAYRLMDRMLVRSDNHATDLLIDALGGPSAVDQWLRMHRLSGIRVDRNIAQLLRARRDLWDIRDSSTPVAMLNLLALIDSGRALSPSSRDLLLSMMSRCATGANRIRGRMPPEAKVEHKTGTLNGYTSDVGFLTLPSGRRVAVAFFARGGNSRPAVIATAARTIYNTFGQAAAAGSNVAAIAGTRSVR